VAKRENVPKNRDQGVGLNGCPKTKRCRVHFSSVGHHDRLLTRINPLPLTTAMQMLLLTSLAARCLEKKTRRFFLIFFSRSPLPVSPGSPEVVPMIDQNRPLQNKIGLIKTFSRVCKASTRRVNRKIADSTRNQRDLFLKYLAANYGGNELCAQGVTVPPDPYSLE